MPMPKLTVTRTDYRVLTWVRLVIGVGFLLLAGWGWYGHSHGANMIEEGNKLLAAGDPASLQKAIPLYQQGAATFHEHSTEALNEGSCYYNIGQAYRKLKQNDKALQAYQQALALYSTDKPSESNDDDWDKEAKGDKADALRNIGVLYDALHKPTQALDSYKQAQQFYTEVGNTKDAATSANNAGLTSLDLGLAAYKNNSWSDALTDFQAGQQFFHQASDRENEAVCWHNMSLSYSHLNQADKAADALKQEKTLQPAAKTP